MYVGRDMTELSMLSTHEWTKEELAYFHHALQQIMPYLNEEGHTIYKELLEEIKGRGGLQRQEADWTHGTKVVYD